MDKIFWYELCFFGDEDSEGKDYNPKKACSYVIKTEIPPVISDEAALRILFRGQENETWVKELTGHLTCVMEICEDEARYFDIEDLTVRVEDTFGVYYIRP